MNYNVFAMVCNSDTASFNSQNLKSRGKGDIANAAFCVAAFEEAGFYQTTIKSSLISATPGVV